MDNRVRRLTRGLAGLAASGLVLGASTTALGYSGNVATITETGPGTVVVCCDPVMIEATVLGAGGQPLAGQPVSWTLENVADTGDASTGKPIAAGSITYAVTSAGANGGTGLVYAVDRGATPRMQAVVYAEVAVDQFTAMDAETDAQGHAHAFVQLSREPGLHHVHVTADGITSAALLLRVPEAGLPRTSAIEDEPSLPSTETLVAVVLFGLGSLLMLRQVALGRRR